MAQYVDRNSIRQTVPVGVVETVIVGVTSLRGSEEHIVELVNDGVEALNATIEVSADGTDPFYPLPDGQFEAIAAGAARPARILAGWQFYRVRGLFSTTPGNVRYSVFAQKWMAHK